jgi:hypothetical protein
MDCSLGGKTDSGLIQRGIYQIDGDTLKMATGEAGKARPAGFAEPGLVTMVYKREKNADAAPAK